jgi:hypothetical protein
MLDNIDEVLADEYSKYNGKPFNIDPMLEDEIEHERHQKEYIMKILNLNWYITERTSSKINENEFSDFLYEWLRNNKGKDFSIPDFYIMKIEILFFCGTYAFYEILQKEDLGYGKELIQKYEHLQKKEENQIKRIEKLLDEFETKKAVLIAENKEDELFQLQKEYHKILINNNGVSILIYIFGRRVVNAVFDRAGIPKIKTCQLISELFVLFSFISKKTGINYGESFYRQLNRINKEKEERLLILATRIVEFLSP